MAGVTAQDVIAKEAELRNIADKIAVALARPFTSKIAAEIEALWQTLAAQHWPYAEMVRNFAQGARAAGLHDASVAQAAQDVLQNAPFRARMWPRIAALIERQLVECHAPLAVDAGNFKGGRETGHLHNLMRALHVLANPLASERDHVPDQNHPDIGLSGPYFMALIHAAYRLALAQGRVRPLRFLDVGCGGGSKVFAASSYFDRADGLELDAGYAAHAQTWMDKVGAPGCRIIAGDALTFDHYADYDVIYLFRPIKDPALEMQLESRVISQARSGTIIVAPMNSALNSDPDANAAQVIDAIYLAKSMPQAAAALRKKADGIGPDYGIDDPACFKQMGFWAPIIRASRAKGFEIGP